MPPTANEIQPEWSLLHYVMGWQFSRETRIPPRFPSLEQTVEYVLYLEIDSQHVRHLFLGFGT
jgi:hypothetical protein